jgi:hypothetical protein
MSVSNFTGKEHVTTRDEASGGSLKADQNKQWSRPEYRRFDRPSVARLAIGTIAEMSREELVGVIEGSGLPLINKSSRQRLNYLDRGSLERLAQLGRRCCQNQGY